ncbi:MAG TPA: hypothetical protein VGC89_08330, partial [Pyrinomonadaceae bacterium]
NDGTPLVADEAPAFDPEATVMSSSKAILEDASSQPASPQPPTQYFTPDSGAGGGSQPEPSMQQQSTPPHAQSNTPAWPPPQQQPQPPAYYPQAGMPGGQQQQQPPPWQGGQQQQQQQQGWQPGQPTPGQNWGGGGYYPQQPGQYAPYAPAGAAAQTAGGSSKVGLASLILSLVAFLSIIAVFIIVSARIYDLRDLIAPLYWGSGALSGLGLVLGVVALVTAKAGTSKAKAIIGMILSVITLALFFLVYANIR